MKLTRLEPGRYRVTLTVNGKDVETKDLVVSPDPVYSPGED
jgi:outer membrane usher protein FimD/PapC